MTSGVEKEFLVTLDLFQYGRAIKDLSESRFAKHCDNALCSLSEQGAVLWEDEDIEGSPHHENEVSAWLRNLRFSRCRWTSLKEWVLKT